MRRDDDRLRRLLLDMVEQAEAWPQHFTFVTMSDEEKQDAYHLQLLEDAGFVAVADERRFSFTDEIPRHEGRPYVRSRILRVTNAGQDFASAIKNDTVWNKTKAGAKKIGGATVQMLWEMAIVYLKQEAAEKLGIELK